MPDEQYMARCRTRMLHIDSLAPELRELIHEEGYTVVRAFIDVGITKAKQIRHLIDTVRGGSEQYGNGTRGRKMRNSLDHPESGGE